MEKVTDLTVLNNFLGIDINLEEMDVDAIEKQSSDVDKQIALITQQIETLSGKLDKVQNPECLAILNKAKTCSLEDYPALIKESDKVTKDIVASCKEFLLKSQEVIKTFTENENK